MIKYNITVNGTVYEVEVEEVRVAASASAAAAPVEAPAANTAPAASAPAPIPKAKATETISTDAVVVKSTMPGNILKIIVSPGEDVYEGQSLIILESMKMETDITAPNAGIIDTIQVSEGSSVNSGDVLLSIK
ncbi:MAG: acetyl-CoA carboxylase biotin carboxyl carrier protein subunit [Eubacteriales bacterium]|nr:acetyl-CoA carboxylase biotin carboxyl carrier protein subunit [Eubacteriales bacterium]